MTGKSETKISRGVVAVRVGVLFVILWLSLSWMAAKALISTRKLEHADVVVVLSGSSTYVERAQWAARLYHDGRASRIILTNDGLLGGYSSQLDRNPFFVELAVAELQRAGVPADKIEVITKLGRSTYDEATILRDYSTQHNLRSLLIVTSAYHSRRAFWVFQRVFHGSEIQLGIEGPPPGIQTPKPATWWLHGLGWKLVPGEYLKLVYYAWRY
jgi:uncharacterized SAM-binding protein YcdF (DUF218 family)